MLYLILIDFLMNTVDEAESGEYDWSGLRECLSHEDDKHVPENTAKMAISTPMAIRYNHHLPEVAVCL